MTFAAWLDGREPPAPPPLRSAVRDLVADTDPSASLPDRLAAAALTALETVASKPSDRSAARSLLAADALLTYACEAAAEAGPAELDRLTRSLTFERFALLLPEAR